MVSVVRDWGLDIGVGGLFAARPRRLRVVQEAWETSTIYYSTKVRFCDKVAEILVLAR